MIDSFTPAGPGRPETSNNRHDQCQGLRTFNIVPEQHYRVADTLERSVGEALGLDTIAIEIGNDTTATSIGVGRYISQDIFLFYQQTFRDPGRANRSGNVVGIEKRLNQRQTLKATGSDLGETSVDWLWRNDY